MSGVSVIMAGALRRDLLARGVRHIDLDDCEAIVARMFGCIHTIERGTAEKLARRCETDLVASDGSCEACGAIQGETCRQLRLASGE
ncbi:hypothetical protein MA20_32150 [Bradyrhizobium japonicum]|uniref:Uncharacterized protein n=1 Tax=Bradyrhizobium japonicum TaxID=375 RepID=A0A0A3XN57_BRAJP|nr:hypothetical protein [Bradyrhizobium japonicum]KGT75842.1 hypothetical protein MA20_32150 [Bradyrhizobium japonicum]